MLTNLKKVAIIGMGKTGASLARYLFRHSVVCEAFDEGEAVLPEDIRIPLHRGKLKAEALIGFDHIYVSPGINWNHPALAAARQQGTPMGGDLDLFLDAYQGPVIAVTGTNGKTTTTHLIETMLETLPAGIDAGGNVGTPMLDLLRDDYTPARVVLELSSFQLERCEMIHPKWAALLNVQPDHADMHENSEAYRAAKLRLFDNQGEGDTAVLPYGREWDELSHALRERKVCVHRFGQLDESNPDADKLTTGILHTSNGDVLFWHQDDHLQTIVCDMIPARGSHQHINLAVAAQAAADFGVHAAVIREALTCFTGLAHRLQHVGMFAGKDWYDDSKATNPDAAAAALKSFEQVLWICGGLRKGLDLHNLAPIAAKRVVHAFVIGKEPRPYTDMLKTAEVPYTIAGDIREAVRLAAEFSSSNPVLLSPAAASQDQFNNYAERGELFARTAAEFGEKYGEAS